MIYIVVALSAEARPLTAHLKLERSEDLTPLVAYRRSDLALVVSGVGRDSAAVAVERLARAVPATRSAVWLNFGVAGHRHLEIGTPVIARSVRDEDTGELFSLSPPRDLYFDEADVRTVSHVETRFETDALYEMEAAAFCRGAAAFTRPELVQVLKIVSDNRRTGTVAVSAHQVQALVERNLAKVDLLISNLHRLARSLSG